MTSDIYATAARLRAEGTPFVLATVVASHPPQSVRPGAKAIVYADGTLEGWVGGGCVRPVVVQEAAEALRDGRSRLVRMNVGATQRTAHGDVREYPMTCQGEGGVEIYLEPALSAPRLVILGHTPVAQSLARFGTELGFEVVVASLGAAAEVFPAGVRVAADAAEALAGAEASTWVVIATMGAGDEEALTTAAASGAAYVGLVASRKKARHLMDYARASGIAAERLDRVKFPAGLDLGGMSAPEIALSVLAEIVQRRYAARDDASGETAARASQESTPGGARGAPPQIQSDSAPPHLRDQITADGSISSRHASPGPSTPPAAPARRARSLAMAPLPVDPVCGMPVNPAEARHTLVVAGETLYFCCPHCKAAYERRPRAPEPAT